MDKARKTKNDPENELEHEEILENAEGLPVINIVLNPDDPENINELAVNVPLFVKKLWRMVNDEQNENIISWNKAGDGFIIHDQPKLIAETLPRYFKHNQLSSFVRQLNLYDFHKIQPLENNVFMFSHPFFLKDVPQLLPLIKRKSSKGRSRGTIAAAPQTNPPETSSQQSSLVQELMTAIRDVKAKNDGITTEMSKIKQENAALWGEVNSLRIKYSKQTKIINKLIHFLIAYMQKHHHSRKSGRTVSAVNSNKYLKTGPKIMELDYKYKNNPHEFWTHYDSQQLGDVEQNEHEAYTVVEPTESVNESDHASSDIAADSTTIHVSPAVEEVLSSASPHSQIPSASPSRATPHFDYATSCPSSSKSSSSALQRSRSSGSKENLGYFIDNSRVEMGTLKELLKNLTPEDMSAFYKLVNDNYRDQEDELDLEAENELISLNESGTVLSNFHDTKTDPQSFPGAQGGSKPNPENARSRTSSENNSSRTLSASPLDHQMDKLSHNMENSTPALPFDEIIQMPNGTMGDYGLEFSPDEFLNSESDDVLNNVSVDQLFNLD